VSPRLILVYPARHREAPDNEPYYGRAIYFRVTCVQMVHEWSPKLKEGEFVFI
jgi:hypothetical protein